MQREKEMEQQNLAKIMQHKQQQQQRNATLQEQQRIASVQQVEEVFHFPQASDLSTSPQTYSVDQQFVRGLEKDLGTSDAIANMLGPNPPPTPGIKVRWMKRTEIMGCTQIIVFLFTLMTFHCFADTAFKCEISGKTLERAI